MQGPELTGGMSGNRLRLHVVICALLCLLGPPIAASAEEDFIRILKEAEAFLHQNTLDLTLERLREAARLAPDDYRVHKVRGDVLLSVRRNREALDAYRQAAAVAPDVLDVYWALWSLLDRMGASQQAIESLREIVRLDSDNPLAHLRLGKSLSQADRLEEAISSYRRAVELDPENLATRLQFARALFDVLDYAGAQREVDWILARTEEHSAERAAARDLLSLLRGESSDKGRRFDHSQTLRKLPWYSDENLRAWVMARGEGWRLREEGRHAEAEAAFRKALSFNPEDHRAMYDLGQTLMQLDRCEEAIEFFEQGIRLTKFGEFYPDSVFRIGRCLTKLGCWKDAIARYERVLEIRDWRNEDFYALNFPDLEKVQEALDEARRHIPDDVSTPPVKIISGERHGPEPYEYPIPPLQNGHKLVDPLPFLSELTSLNDTTTVHGPFRQIMTARDVVQDDVQTGLHDFIPINPTDTFQQQDREIYLVFRLTSNQEAMEVKLTGFLMSERVTGLPPNSLIGMDNVLLGLNERSGYFLLRRPESGWQPGIYRVDLYLGPQVSAYSRVGEIRFRIVTDSGTQRAGRN